MVIDSKLVIMSQLQEKFPEAIDKISILEPSLQKRPFFIGFSKKISNHKKLAKDFDKGMGIIKRKDIYRTIMKKLNIKLKGGNGKKAG